MQPDGTMYVVQMEPHLTAGQIAPIRKSLSKSDAVKVTFVVVDIYNNRKNAFSNKASKQGSHVLVWYGLDNPCLMNIPIWHGVVLKEVRLR